LGRKSKQQIELEKNSIQPNIDNDNNVSNSDNIKSEKIENLLSDYKNDAEAQKPKRKKLLKNEVEAQNSFAVTSTIAVHIGLNLLIARMPKPVPLTDEEGKAFDEAFTNLAKKYYSSVQRFGEEINFIIVLGFLILGRIDFEKSKKPETEKKESE
jgi:hypothetical protein